MSHKPRVGSAPLVVVSRAAPWRRCARESCAAGGEPHRVVDGIKKLGKTFEDRLRGRIVVVHSQTERTGVNATHDGRRPMADGCVAVTTCAPCCAFATSSHRPRALAPLCTLRVHDRGHASARACVNAMPRLRRGSKHTRSHMRAQTRENLHAQKHSN